MPLPAETILSLILGVGLSAACGFRVFVPPLIVSIAALSGHLELSPGFAWVASYPALIALATASVLEILCYYIPIVDNFMDSVATPAAIVAGVATTASMVADTSPMLAWAIAVIAGGVAAGTVQATTVALRGASTLSTGGLANPLVSSIELGGAVATSVLAMIAPILTLILILLLVIAVRKFYLSQRAHQLVPPS